MRTVLIFNPTSGISTVTGKRMSSEETERTFLEGLRACGIEPHVLHTSPEDGGEGMARRAAQDGAELVIAAGGDGTIHAVANGLVGTQSILGIIATGTMNNLAHSLNIPDTIPAACFTIANGETRTIDVGKINDHTFLEAAGVGVEAALFPAAEEIKHLRARSLRVTANAPLEIHADGEARGYTPAEVRVLPAALRIRVTGKDAPGLHEGAVKSEDMPVT